MQWKATTHLQCVKRPHYFGNFKCSNTRHFKRRRTPVRRAKNNTVGEYLKSTKNDCFVFIG